MLPARSRGPPLRPGAERVGERWGTCRDDLADLRTRTRIARKLRRDATDVERRLWRALRETALPWKFRRQHPIGRRIADFACPVRKLVIELDGGQHAEEWEEDAARSAELAAHGYRVIRFWNNEVIENLDGVLRRVLRELEASPPHPDPLRPEGGEGVERSGCDL